MFDKLGKAFCYGMDDIKDVRTNSQFTLLLCFVPIFVGCLNYVSYVMIFVFSDFWLVINCFRQLANYGWPVPIWVWIEELINQQVFEMKLLMIKSLITFNPNDYDHEFNFFNFIHSKRNS